MSYIGMKQLLEAGVHFGHETKRWNPKFKRFIFAERNGIFIIDLQKTLKQIDRSFDYIKDLSERGGTILFVGTKKQAQEIIELEARRTGMPFVTSRWLGGMLTNFRTMRTRVTRLDELDELFESGRINDRPKAERIQLGSERDRLLRYVGGIRKMTRLPDALFIIDPTKEIIAVQEANKLGIPVIAILDSNSDPAGVTFPIPGNDDAIRAITLYCDLIAGAVLDGISAEMVASGRDIGAAEELPPEALPDVAAEIASQPAASQPAASPPAASPPTA